MDTPQPVLAAFTCLIVCRAMCLIAALIAGCSMAWQLSGAPYYALVEQGETIAPYCRVILHPFDENGVEIGFDNRIGGFGVDSGYKATAGVSIGNIQRETGYDIATITPEMLNPYSDSPMDENGHWLQQWQFMKAPQCELQFTKVGTTGEETYLNKWKVMIHDLAEGKQLKMPAFCGDEESGAFTDMYDGPRAFFGGMWAGPLVMGLCLWFILRCVMLAVSAYIEVYCLGNYKNLSAKYLHATWLFPLFKFIINNIAISFLMAPIQNMEFHELCPQLLLSYYSGKLQLGFQWGCMAGTILAVLLVILGCIDECCKCLVADCALIASIGLVVYFCLAAGCMVIGGIWYHVKKAWWVLFLGIDINLNWYFEEYDLAMKLNVFHLFTFFLLLGDLLDYMLSAISGAYKCMNKGVD